MARNNVLSWRDGRGWLVLAGGAAIGSSIRAQAIGRTAADGGVAYVALGASNSIEAVLEDFEDLGAPSGYVVDVLSEDDDTIRSKLAEAGMVVISTDSDAETMHSGLLGAAAQGMELAFASGALILVEGVGSAVLGEMFVSSRGEYFNGLGWLDHALVLPGVVSIAETQVARAALVDHPSLMLIGIGDGSALALGPDGEFELWGDKQVTVAIGHSYTSSVA
ncbi:MAG: hypothetical protein R3E39_01595, partial [Anaerolineae bacterium]